MDAHTVAAAISFLVLGIVLGNVQADRRWRRRPWMMKLPR